MSDGLSCVISIYARACAKAGHAVSVVGFLGLGPILGLQSRDCFHV